jgi:alkylation response protein AidB-like acyl-CoA dehydrogenase
MSDAFEELRQQVRDWLAAHPPPDRDFALPQSMLSVSTDEQFDYLRDWQARVYAAGFVGSEWPAEYGGGGRPAGSQRAIDQELSRADVPYLINMVGLSWAGPIILNFGTEAQKKRYLAKLLRADEIWCQGFSEPEAGSDLASLQTSAVRDGDDYLIDGHKVWTTLGRFAHHMILLARTDPDAGKHAGISYFLSPMKVDGVQVVPLIKLTGEEGFNQIIFTQARIPSDTLLGREGQGWELAIATLNFERGASEGSAGGAGGFGAAPTEALFELARGLVRDGRPALQDPGVRDRLAAFAIEAAAIRYSGQRMRVPALCSDRPMALPLLSKVAVTEFVQRLADFGCEVQGYAGTLYEGDPAALDSGDWQKQYLNSYANTIAGGTSEIVRNVIGEKVLGLPKTR